MTALLKDALVAVSDTSLFSAGVSLLENCVRDDQVLRVLTYHRIDDPARRPELYPGLIGPSPREFLRQMELISRCYRVVSLADVIAAARGTAKLPERAVLITFDDATEDFQTHVWPVMRLKGLPATMFVPTAFPDNPQAHFWWDRLYRAVTHAPTGMNWALPWGPVTVGSAAQRPSLIKQLKELLKRQPHAAFLDAMERITSSVGVPDPSHNGVLSWDQLRTLDRQGLTLAPHTQNHPMLNHLTKDEIRTEIECSWRDLKSQICPGIPRVLAYPAGGVNDDVTDVLADLKFDLAFTTQRGVNSLPLQHRWKLRRIGVGARTTLGLLRAQLAFSAG